MKEFDKYIKDNLYNHESPVPEGLWERIVLEKDKKKPSPIPFWKNGYFQSAILAVLTIGILGSAHWYTNKNSNTSAITTQKETQLVKSTVIDNSSPINANKTSANTTTPSTSVKEENTTGSSVASSATIKQLTSDKKNISSLASQLIMHKLNRKNANSVYKTTDSLSSSTFDSKEYTTNTVATNNLIENDKLVTNWNENNTIEQTNEIDNHYFERGSIVKKTTDILSNKSVSKTLTDNRKTITEIHLPTINSKNWRVELYASPDYDCKKTSVSNTNSFYAQALDTTQKLSVGFTVGLRIAKTLTNHLSLKSGIQFKETSERFRYKQFSTKNLTVVTERSYIDNAGATITSKDTSTYMETGYRLMTTYNTYKNIEIPILASWEVERNKWSFAFSVGVIANIASFYEGKTFDNGLNIAPLSAKQQNGVLNNSLNFSFYSSLSLAHEMGKDFDFFAEPYCKLGLTNSSNASFGFGQRFNSYGVNLGIRYKIPTASIK